MSKAKKKSASQKPRQKLTNRRRLEQMLRQMITGEISFPSSTVIKELKRSHQFGNSTE